MNQYLKTLCLKKKSSTRIILFTDDLWVEIDLLEENETIVDFICEIIIEYTHLWSDIIPATDEQFALALDKLCGSTFKHMNDFDILFLGEVIENIQFNDKFSIMFFLPTLLSRFEIIPEAGIENP